MLLPHSDSPPNVFLPIPLFPVNNPVRSCSVQRIQKLIRHDLQFTSAGAPCSLAQSAALSCQGLVPQDRSLFRMRGMQGSRQLDKISTVHDENQGQNTGAHKLASCLSPTLFLHALSQSCAITLQVRLLQSSRGHFDFFHLTLIYLNFSGVSGKYFAISMDNLVEFKLFPKSQKDFSKIQAFPTGYFPPLGNARLPLHPAIAGHLRFRLSCSQQNTGASRPLSMRGPNEHLHGGLHHHGQRMGCIHGYGLPMLTNQRP